MASSVQSLIHNARSLLGLGLEELRRAIEVSAEAVPGDEYGKMEDVTSVDGLPGFPGTIYLQNDSVALIRIGHDALTGYSTADIKTQLGNEQLQLPSRAGKLAALYLHADQGVAYSAQKEQLHFMEVFHSCTTQEYQALIYRKPGPFIR